MRKGFLIMLAVALVAALAAPAVAGTDINGFYRAKGYISNYNGVPQAAVAPPGDNTLNLQNDPPTSAYVDQRMRLRFSSGEENVKAVAQFEIDFSSWGDSAGGAAPGAAARNSGGALGGDKINLETKNAYLWFKLPNTSIDFTVGLQGQTDTYAGILYGAADMAGIFMTGKMEPVTWKLGWAKLYENTQWRSDDLDLWVAEVKLQPTKDIKLGLNFNYIQDDTQKQVSATSLPFATAAGNRNAKKIYTPGIDFSLGVPAAAISGFAFYQWGTVDSYESGQPDVDISGYALDLRADANVGPVKGFLEALYISGGDGTGNDYESIVTLSDLNASPGGNSAYGRTDMELLLFNNDDINTSQSLIGTAAATTSQSPGAGGRGITHFAAGGSMKLGAALTAKAGLGYLMVTKKLSVADANRKGKGMGTELNANVNYNIAKGLDFGVYGAYAWLGDFYEFNTSGAKNPDDIYDVHARLNYAF
jgi:hypothetical protein